MKIAIPPIHFEVNGHPAHIPAILFGFEDPLAVLENLKNVDVTAFTGMSGMCPCITHCDTTDFGADHYESVERALGENAYLRDYLYERFALKANYLDIRRIREQWLNHIVFHLGLQVDEAEYNEHQAN